jgi:hypothetical protein
VAREGFTGCRRFGGLFLRNEEIKECPLAVKLETQSELVSIVALLQAGWSFSSSSVPSNCLVGLRSNALADYLAARNCGHARFLPRSSALSSRAA